MSQIFSIENDKVVIKKLALETLEGNLTVAGTLTVDNLIVTNAPAEPAKPGSRRERSDGRPDTSRRPSSS